LTILNHAGIATFPIPARPAMTMRVIACLVVAAIGGWPHCNTTAIVELNQPWGQ